MMQIPQKLSTARSIYNEYKYKTLEETLWEVVSSCAGSCLSLHVESLDNHLG